MNNERNFKGVWVPKEIWLSRDLTPLEKLYLVEIDSLDDEINGCYATNKHFEMMFGQKGSNISRVIENLRLKGWVDVEYFYNGKEIDKRVIKIKRPPYPEKYVKNDYGYANNDYRVYSKLVEGYAKNDKERYTYIDNNILNEFKIYNVFEKNLKCECISKSTNDKCQRRAMYNINGINYCNQHSRGLIPNLEIKSKRFTKPTIDEIQQYCNERNNGINAEAFYDFYETKDWYVGKNKMKDWKACVRTWEARNKKTSNKKDWEKLLEN